MKKNLLLIYNPKAGKGSFLLSLPDVIDLFVKAGFSVEAYPTQGPEDAIRKLQYLDEEVDLVVTAGGDGTIDEIATGLVRLGRNIPVGYIPVGSTNDFASSLGLYTNALSETRAIIGGLPSGVDIGEFNQGTFVYVAAFGTFTDVAYATNQDLKNIFGRLAYLFEATKRLADIKSYRITVTVNGETRTDDYAFGMVTNSTQVGGIKGITGKDITMDDGLFEVMLIHTPRTIFDAQNIVGALILGDQEMPMIEFFKASEITLDSKEEISWTLDGEYGGTVRHVTIRDRKKAMQIMLNEEQRALLTETGLKTEGK
jgi:YegS/Rv2252/BmrU family lipid kinase